MRSRSQDIFERNFILALYRTELKQNFLSLLSAIMKSKLSSLLLASTIFALNALPVRAFDSFNANISNTAMLRGRWCFEFIQIGLLCVDL